MKILNKILRVALPSLLALSFAEAEACTNLIVGKKASVDGSVMVSYNADDYGMFSGLCHYPAGVHAKGEMRKIFDWDSGVYHGEIPEAPVTYNVIGNINEYQLSIAETTYGGREEMVDTTGILDYGSLIYVALQRAKTAREAISVMTSLVEKYGYCSSGETFSICDPNEAWIMEMMGTGPGSKGVVWVAMRIPDDAICAHANQSRIGKFDMKDKKNVLYSKNVISYARWDGSQERMPTSLGRTRMLSLTSQVVVHVMLVHGASSIASRRASIVICLGLLARTPTLRTCRFGWFPTASLAFTT